MDWSYRDFPGTTICPPPFHGLEDNDKFNKPLTVNNRDLEEYWFKLQQTPMADDKDMVNSPAHYTQGDIECIDAIAQVVKDLDGMEAMCTGNAIKYLWRWKHKNGVEDLKKAQWYLQRMIDNWE